MRSVTKPYVRHVNERRHPACGQVSRWIVAHRRHLGDGILPGRQGMPQTASDMYGAQELLIQLLRGDNEL
jgi:hypothetical protein